MTDVIAELVEVAGRVRVKITVRDDGKVVDADMVDPFNATQRRKTAERLAAKTKNPDVREQIELEVLRCVDKAKEREEKEDSSDEELIDGKDVWMVRPELIVVPGVVGVSVPETVIKNNEVIGRWRMYLGWADGKRETRELCSRIEAPSCPMADTLWVQPMPPDPAPGSVAGWSGESRSAGWMDKGR